MLRGQSGASAVEFAIVLPLLLLLIFGILEFSLAWSRVQGMNAAAREGARVAALGRDTTYEHIEDRVLNAAPPFVSRDDVEVAVYPEGAPGSDAWCTSNAPSRRVVVEVSLDNTDTYRINIPGAGSWGPDYRATGVFRCEYNRPTT